MDRPRKAPAPSPAPGDEEDPSAETGNPGLAGPARETCPWSGFPKRLELARLLLPTRTGEMSPVLGQNPAQLYVSDAGEAGTGQHHDVQFPQLPAVMPKAVSHYPLYPVAAYCLGDSFARDRHAETSSTQVIGAGEHEYLPAAGAQGLGEYPLEVSRPGEPEEPGEAGSRGGGLGVRTQALSLLRPLARRFLMIRRPAFVAMRARKP